MISNHIADTNCCVARPQNPVLLALAFPSLSPTYILFLPPICLPHLQKMYTKLLRFSWGHSTNLQRNINGASFLYISCYFPNDPLYSPQEYVRLLGGFGGFKQAKERPTTPFGAFCSKKMGEGNVGMVFPHYYTICFKALTLLHYILR